ncbi:MAG: hypothetical protein OXJ64_15190 [Boseongicola sp.]|nr:hypothetical protein [Boseongicola sp.]
MAKLAAWAIDRQQGEDALRPPAPKRLAGSRIELEAPGCALTACHRLLNDAANPLRRDLDVAIADAGKTQCHRRVGLPEHFRDH